jgi:hypothetical protein
MNLKKIYRFALILFLIAPSWAGAQIYDPDKKLQDLGIMRILVEDSSSSGCWTNIREAINYAEIKLELAGARLVPSSNYWPAYYEATAFVISVTATRNSAGTCGGLVKISTGAFYNGTDTKASGLIYYSSVATAATDGENFNQLVLGTIQDALNEWEDRD